MCTVHHCHKNGISLREERTLSTDSLSMHTFLYIAGSLHDNHQEITGTRKMVRETTRGRVSGIDPRRSGQSDVANNQSAGLKILRLQPPSSLSLFLSYLHSFYFIKESYKNIIGYYSMNNILFLGNFLKIYKNRTGALCRINK